MELIKRSYIYIIEYYTRANCITMDETQKYNADWSKICKKSPQTPKFWYQLHAGYKCIGNTSFSRDENIC